MSLISIPRTRHVKFESGKMACTASLFFILASASAQPAGPVSGRVYEAVTKAALIGATVYLENKNTGTTTDRNGSFQLNVPFEKDTIILVIGFVGYETRRLPVTASSCPCSISLSRSVVTASEVVISASRLPETILESPVTILKMNTMAVKEAPSENFYAALQTFKGVDVLTNSLLYKTLNTRGFNNNANYRFTQLVDGIDNSLVGLGWPFGNVLGTTDLDVEKVELIPGPASALYGANAFNGLLYISTKDPFRYQGVTMQVKNGINHLGTDLHDPSWYGDIQFRYAKAVSDRFAFKVNAGYIQGQDWQLTDSSDIDLFATDQIRGSGNPARDAVNIYGDEAVRRAWVTDPSAGKIDVSRTGYAVSDLIDNSTYSFKAAAALEYKLNSRLDLGYSFNYAQATTSYSSLYKLKNIRMYSQRLELTGTDFFLRAAAIADDLGDTYSISALANNMNASWKSNTDWFNAFKKAYQGSVPGVSANDLDMARAYADSGRVDPGTDAFNHLKESLVTVPFSSGGAKVIDHSSKYFLQGQYDFKRQITFLELIAGFDYNLTRLNSEGSIFNDEPGSPIFVNQYAGYAQATKNILKERLKLLATLRYDKADNFKGVWSPRFAAVYHPDDRNYFRASWQQGFRLPDPQLQFMDIIVGSAHRLGGTAEVDEPYNSRYNSFTQASTVEFNNAVKALLADTTVSVTLDSAVNRFSGLLQKSPYDYIQPERVHTFELGYRRLLFSNKVYVDVNYFHNSYTGFIFSTSLVQPDSGGVQDAASIHTAGISIYYGATENFVTFVNSPDRVLMNGVEIGASLQFHGTYVLSGNLTWIHSNIEPGQPVPGIRTPPWKSNLSISNRNLTKHLGFTINWRWTDAITNWSNVTDQASIDNDLPACSIIDLQVSWRVPEAATSIKLGASNLLNYYHQDYAQGISVGGIYYVSLLFDGIFK